MLILYNTLMLAALCLLCPLWIPLVRFRKKYRKTFFSRLYMEPFVTAETSPPVWIHALSVGEVLSAEPLVTAMAEKYGAANLVFSASTHTGVEMANRMIAAHVRAVRHFPYDTIVSVNRALAVIRPRMVVIVETDLWPNFLCRLNQCNIPVYLVNARLSGRSFRGYKRIDAVMVPLLSIFRRICVQSERDRRRFRDLGLPGGRIITVGNLKFDQVPVDISLQERERLSATLRLPANQPVWVAGSTHPNEEEILARVYQRLGCPEFHLTLIIAPRDPGRAISVCEMFNRLGIHAVTLAQLEKQDRPSAVVVVDRLGVLRKLYALADISFVGGSLVKAGGHNPLEPASVAKPILYGPYTDDFDWISRTLENAGGAKRVSSDDNLAEVINELLANKDRRIEMGRKAYAVFNRHQGAVDRTLAIIEDDSLSAALPVVHASAGLD